LLVVAMAIGAGTGTLAGCETGSLADVGVTLSDESPLADDVRAALRASSETLNANILVKALDGGKVRLSGLMNNEALIHTAEQIARDVPGVTGVVNTLQVR